MKNKVVILGAGPCGIAMGYYLKKKARILILEKNSYVGGISTSKKYKKIYYDLGSHRFLPSFKGNALVFLKKNTKKKLQKNERKGLIRLHNIWLKYPLRIFDAYKISFFTLIRWIFSSIYYKLVFFFIQYDNTSHHAFLRSFGKSFTKDFYKPFFSKVFGKELKKLSDEQFKRRVSAKSILNIIKKSISNFFKSEQNYYYYIPEGVGELYKEIEKKHLRENILKDLNIRSINIKKQIIIYNKNKKINYDKIVSTIPLNDLIKLTEPRPPKDIYNSGKYLKYRSIVLPYFVVRGTNKFESETLYFPEGKYIFNRVYFPDSYYKKNLKKKREIYIIGLEITCNFEDKIWKMNSRNLKNKILQNIKDLELFKEQDIEDFFIEKEKYAYPIYLRNYSYHLEKVKNFYYKRGVMLNGRQGLFLHNNQHHSIEMAYYASKALLSNNTIDTWKKKEILFEKYQVTD